MHPQARHLMSRTTNFMRQSRPQLRRRGDTIQWSWKTGTLSWDWILGCPRVSGKKNLALRNNLIIHLFSINLQKGNGPGEPQIIKHLTK